MNTKKTVLTGDRPTGPLHIGHYVGSMLNRVRLQDEYDESFYMVADVQALTDNFDNPQKVHDNVIQVLADNLAVGVDPEKTTMFIQSQIPQIAELTVYFMNLVTMQQMLHNPTIKTEVAQKGYGESIPLGFLAYPVSQAADILFAKAGAIPVGEDQRPHIESSRDIARKFNATYKCNVFPEPEIVISETPRLVGSDGNAKMSKSLGNAIYLGDQPDVIEKKIKGMFTCPSKVRVTDTVGDEELSKNVVFQYLDIFAPQQAALVSQMKQDYKEGKIGDSEGKKLLNEVLQELLLPIRTRREELLKDPAAIMEIARKGSEKARLIGEQTMREVRAAMKIGYFD